MSSYEVDPDLVIVFGLRASISMVGLMLLFNGLWKMEYTWDEEGTAAYERAQLVKGPLADAKYHSMEGAAVREGVEFSSEGGIVLIPTQELKDAMPIHRRFLMGCPLWALSFLFDTDGSLHLYANVWNIFCLFLVINLCLVVGFCIRLAMMCRNLRLKNLYFNLLVLLGLLFMTSIIMDPENGAPWYFSVIGTCLVFASYHPMKRARKMGSTWDTDGAPNYRVYSQHLGTLFLIFGLFLLWVSANAVPVPNDGTRYIPIYLSGRTLMAFISGMFIIIPSSLALDYAFDEGSEPRNYFPGLNGNTFLKLALTSEKGELLAQKQEWKLAFRSVAQLVETPMFLLLGWFLFGVSSCMPFDHATWEHLILYVLSIVPGIITVFLILPAYWDADFKDFKRWSKVYGISMIVFCAGFGLLGQGPMIMGMIGCVLIILGQRFDMLERKRGFWWVGEQTANPNPSAFNFGHPPIVLGWILLCLGMSVP